MHTFTELDQHVTLKENVKVIGRVADVIGDVGSHAESELNLPEFLFLGHHFGRGQLSSITRLHDLHLNRSKLDFIQNIL